MCHRSPNGLGWIRCDPASYGVRAPDAPPAVRRVALDNLEPEVRDYSRRAWYTVTRRTRVGLPSHELGIDGLVGIASATIDAVLGGHFLLQDALRCDCPDCDCVTTPEAPLCAHDRACPHTELLDGVESAITRALVQRAARLPQLAAALAKGPQAVYDLAGLTQAQRECFALDLAGATNVSIARITGLPSGSISFHLKHAKTRLAGLAREPLGRIAAA